MKTHYCALLRQLLIATVAVSLSIGASVAIAKNYSLAGGDVVGRVYELQPRTGITMYNLITSTGIGFEELAAANPKHGPDLHNHRHPIVIPDRFVLPNTPKSGIVINVAELRLYYYPKGSTRVVTYPVGIGRKGWKTPLTRTSIVSKTANPIWRVPKSIQLDVAARKGIILPDKIPAGDKNPLGTHAMYLGIGGYLIHGTNAPYGVGQRVSSGCIRLMPHNIISLYNQVSVGTSVRIVNQPYKIGWANNRLYLEAHPVPGEYKAKRTQYKANMKKTIATYAKKYGANVNWNKVQRVADEKLGTPQVIATR